MEEVDPQGPSGPETALSTDARTVRRVTWLALGLNLALAVMKFLAGYFGNSQAVVADAVNSLSDSTTDLAVLVGSVFWSKPPDAGHPYGHKRIETIVATVIGASLAAAGVSLAWGAVVTMGVRHTAGPGPAAFAAAIVTLVVKECMYRWTLAVGTRIRSIALEAKAWDHRSDAMTSVPVALAVAGAMFFPDWVVLDHLGALVVSVFVLRAAVLVVRPAVRQLVDAAAPRTIRDEILRIAATVKGVEGVHALRTRYAGSHLYIDLHVLVDGRISVESGHDIAETVSRRLVAEGLGILDAVVHIEPDSEGRRGERSRRGGQTT